MSVLAENQASANERPALIAQRYDVHELLGRGGMACVYRVTDRVSGRALALKQLLPPPQPELAAEIAGLFEREFHTLAQLSHPRVIAVYDYGVDAGVPYYTMELLDGGDLRDRAPLPWREACALLFDVCSSLALLHSRRLLHRDISPRNVRCTRDGKAKLIDFGAMVPMGTGGAQIVGTPAFTPPESVHRSALDGRADLFSLGATLYYALTGALAFPARTFADVVSAWNFKPPPPSTRSADVPAALDDLVGALLNLEPALRPRNAFEVMQRLAAIAELPSDESAAVSRAYLATPVLVGREQTLITLRLKTADAIQGRGGGVIIRASAGLGRSRVLDACGLGAKALGATVLRSTASGSREAFSVALGLVQHLLEALPLHGLDESFPDLFEPAPQAANQQAADTAALAPPRLKDPNALRSDAGRLQHAITRLLLTVSRTHPLVVTVDDVQRIDEPSASVLAAVLDKARRGCLLVAMTLDDDAAHSSLAMDVLTRRCEQLDLHPLTREQTQALLGSVFGDVPNLQLLSQEIFRVAAGNPRQSMDLAQHLIDRHSIQYTAGIWTLPSALSTADLPGSVAEALHARIDALQPLARQLAEAQALAFHELFKYEDYHGLFPEQDQRAVDSAISELVSKQVLVSDGRSYSIANRIWVSTLTARLTVEQRERLHGALSDLYRSNAPMAQIHHAFEAGHDGQGLVLLLARLRDYAERFDLETALEMNASSMGPSYQRAIQTAIRLGRPARELNELKRWSVALSVAAGASYYWPVAPGWLAQLEQDSGLCFWRQDSASPAGERITHALQHAQQRYLTTPEHDRVYRVDEAIRNLAQYVAVSIAISVNSMSPDLFSSLPALLEPFAPLSPVLDAIWQNALATCESERDCRYELARSRWIAVHAKLDTFTGSELEHVDVIRNAVAFGVGMTEATLGLASATRWAELLDQDPLQKLSALRLRKIVRLEQGDWLGADRLQRQAEVLALQARSPQMFETMPVMEMAAHASARDLVGVQQVIQRIEPLAARHPGWLPHLRLAEARFQLIRGDWANAASGFEHCIEISGPEGDRRTRSLPVWIAAQAGLSEALLALGQTEAARAGADVSVRRCDALEVGAYADELRRALALAEAKSGKIAQANARLDALVQKQLALGVTGLKLGLSYEALAQVAIWNGDEPAFEGFARLTAQAYRAGAGCPLSARYERLLNDAVRCGFQRPAGLSEFESNSVMESAGSDLQDISAVVTQALRESRGPQERFTLALELICQVLGAKGGHYYELRAEDSLELGGSCGTGAPPESLLALVREYMARELERSDTLTVMATESLPGTQAVSGSLVQAAGVTYELMLLACVTESAGQVAGVMAIAAGPERVRSTKQAQLLSVLAAQLIQAAASGARHLDARSARSAT